jgi:hypothetical protein
MSRIPGFKSETQRERFADAATFYVRGGPLARSCGAKLRTGGVCDQLALESEARCLRHGGPDAARRFRARQLRGLETGSVSPEEWARAEAKRARNALAHSWRKDPRLPGATIDLGPHEEAFIEAARTMGVDVVALYPAQADWLRWRWQRTQRDRDDAAAWTRAVQFDLPQQKAAAAVAVLLADLGVKDGRTRVARAAKTALRAGGVAQAQRVLAAFREAQSLSSALAGQDRRLERPKPLTNAAPKPWTARATADGWKRRMPNAPKPAHTDQLPKRPVGRPRRVPDARDEIAALGEVLRAAGPPVRAMFATISSEADQLRFLRDLNAHNRAPDDERARRSWMAWVRAVGQV